ncbi:Tetratricopeptide repeat [Phytophthora infestans]|uniref:Tetratricopeptide repeat n=1 Tax=Phytophthora infestans TaxID=4787 RepID=A0A833W8R4_PHYIN|nr:Tetratricopeptide repeat [Phytophthora infestans]
MQGPPLESESIGCTPSTRTYPDGTVRSARGSSASSHRRLRQELSYPATAQWAFLTSTNTQQTNQQRPSRPSTARVSAPSEGIKLPKRPATSRTSKTQIRHHEHEEHFTTRSDTIAIQEAIRRERNQEQNENYGVIVPSSCRLHSRDECYRTSALARAFQARANGDYDRAIKFYTSLSTAKPSEIEAKFQLAVCLERTGQIRPALAAYKQVKRLSGGQHAFAFYNMGNLCMRVDKVAQAVDYFSRAISVSKDKKGSNRGSTPSAFYRQRAAAYRKNGDFEKAAQDYDLVQKNSGGSTTLADESVMYTAEHLYNTVKRATSPKKRIPQQSVHNDEIARGLEIEPDTNQDTNECQSEPDETEDALTAWTLQRSLEIARLPPSERSDSDLQYLVDFMQKRFLVCAALNPEVCKLLCRDLVLSPDGALPARTPIFMEQNGVEAPHDKSLYFIFQGRVSVSKTAGRMFQLSAEYLESSEERFKVQEELDEAEMGASDVTAYSAITTTTCVIWALSWHQWSRIDRAQHEVERDRAARFLSMAPAFNNIPVVDIRNLANRSTFVKVIGSKVVCCEGQSVNGLILVREGELCKFSPCGLRTPPDMSISFALSGRLSESQSARLFYTQLETAGDPLSFLRINEAHHGFLPQNYVKSKQRELLRAATTRPKSTNTRRTSVAINCMGTGRGTTPTQPVALALRRGECFCASSSWVPPRQSRQEKQQIHGISCAKAALISVSTVELLFLSAADIMQGFSADSRSQLHRNLQDIALMNKHKYKTDLSRLRGPPGGRRNSNLLEQLVRDTHWSKFKQELVESVLRGRT